MATKVIEYLKKATGYKPGKTRKVSPKEAEILVNLGIAKYHSDTDIVGDTSKPEKRQYRRKDMKAQD